MRQVLPSDMKHQTVSALCVSEPPLPSLLSCPPRAWLPSSRRCKWFELWAANVREAVARGQMLVVFYFRGHLARHGAEWADSKQVRRVCIEPASVGCS